MAKKTKDAAATPKKTKEVKPKAPPDPVKTQNLIRLLNIVALLLAIAAFLFLLFAVLSHHWKWQTTNLHEIMSPTYHYAGPNIYEDSRINHHYGLFSLKVQVYANNDEQIDLQTATRFPRIDDGEENFHNCLSQTSTLRGVLLTCSNRVVSRQICHCRRYHYWNFVIAFEIIALILLGVAIVLTALLTTQFHGILRLAGAGVALLAFLLLLIGLILILTHLKHETRSLADAYPHVHQLVSDKLGIVHDQYRGKQRYPSPSVLRRAIRRQADLHDSPDHYRAYPLLPGQHPFNETHFTEYSEAEKKWVYTPYKDINVPVAYAALSQPDKVFPQPPDGSYPVPSKQDTTTTQPYNPYGPALGYDTVYNHTRAGIGWSTVLSIIALILALLLALVLIFSWLTDKKLSPNKKTVTKTVKTTTEYVVVPQEEVTVQTEPKSIPTTYSSDRPAGDALVTTHHPPGAQSERVIVHDVIVPSESAVTTQQ